MRTHLVKVESERFEKKRTKGMGRDRPGGPVLCLTIKKKDFTEKHADKLNISSAQGSMPIHRGERKRAVMEAGRQSL